MRQNPLVEFDVVQHGAQIPVLNQGVAGDLAVVHHTCKHTDTCTAINTNTTTVEKVMFQRCIKMRNRGIIVKKRKKKSQE